MEGATFLTLLGGAVQLIVALLILRADGRARVRASLAALFLLNGVSILATHLSGGDTASPWWYVVVAADEPTGALLVDAGVLLSAGRLARFQRASGVLVLAALVTMPALVLGLGLTHSFHGRLSDALVMLGFAVALLGTSLGLRAGPPTPFHLAAFLAFAPRAIEFLVLGLHALPENFATGSPYVWWRTPFVVATAAILYRTLRHGDRATVVATIVATGVGTLFALAQALGAGALVLRIFTLIVSRPVFLLVGLALSTRGDPLFVDRREIVLRATLATAGATLGVLLHGAFQWGAPGEDLVPVLFAVGLGLSGFALGGLPFDAAARARARREAAAAASPWPDAHARQLRDAFERRPPTQGERVLLALRGVAFDPQRAAPPEAGTARICAAAGVPGKHLPAVVRRLNERNGERLVAADAGDVEGVRRRGVPRYRLTSGGAAEADSLARAYGVDAWPPDVLRRAMETVSAGFDGQTVAGVRGEPPTR